MNKYEIKLNDFTCYAEVKEEKEITVVSIKGSTKDEITFYFNATRQEIEEELTLRGYKVEEGF